MSGLRSAHDVAAFRREFPGLARRVHLASCSLGARSARLDAAIGEMLDASAGPDAWHAFEEQTDLVRHGAAALLGARTAQVALMPNASTGAYQVASTFRWQRRPRLITTVTEFPSIAHVWLAQRPLGAEVVFVGDARTGTVCADDYLAAIDDRAALVSVPATTYRDGTRLPVAAIAAAAHAAGAKVIVDAYQAVGVEPVQVNALRCDYLIAGFSKYLLGLPGAAMLYARAPQDGDRDPQLTGWFGRVRPFAFDQRLDFPPEARRFETGTPAVPAMYAATAGLSLIAQLNLNVVRQHVQDLVAYAAEQLRAQGETVRLSSNPNARGAHVPVLDRDPAALAAWLAARHITVSPRGEVMRLSVHAYTSRTDIDEVCVGIRAYRRRVGAPVARRPDMGMHTLIGGRR